MEQCCVSQLKGIYIVGHLNGDIHAVITCYA